MGRMGSRMGSRKCGSRGSMGRSGHTQTLTKYGRNSAKS